MLKHIVFKIAAIEELSFSMDKSARGQQSEIDVDIEGDTAYNELDKTISIYSKVTFSLTEFATPVLQYAVAIKFYIDNYEEIIEFIDGQSIVDTVLENKLIDISLHTIRGMLFSRTAGTGLENCYLPLVD